MLGRPVRFHDLAFFDPVIYESLRQLVADAEKPGSDNASALQALDLTFSIDLCVEEGGGSVDLITNGLAIKLIQNHLQLLTCAGRETEVSHANIYQYVRKYAEYRMVNAQEKALKKVRNGSNCCLLAVISPADAGRSVRRDPGRLAGHSHCRGFPSPPQRCWRHQRFNAHQLHFL